MSLDPVRLASGSVRPWTLKPQCSASQAAQPLIRLHGVMLRRPTPTCASPRRRSPVAAIRSGARTLQWRPPSAASCTAWWPARAAISSTPTKRKCCSTLCSPSGCAVESGVLWVLSVTWLQCHRARECESVVPSVCIGQYSFAQSSLVSRVRGEMQCQFRQSRHVMTQGLPFLPNCWSLHAAHHDGPSCMRTAFWAAQQAAAAVG